ncbi:MAG: hypothetical protein AAB071_05280 [Bacteroidota bacterium]
MIISDIHFEEVIEIKDFRERLEILSFLNRFGTKGNADKQSVRMRAKELRRMSFGIADSLHVAIAETLAEIFITTDDQLLRKCKKASKIVSLNPIEFCNEENLL